MPLMSTFTYDLTLAGLSVGSAAALTGIGLIVTYRATGVLNFAHGAIAMVCAYVLRQCVVGWGWPLWLGAVVTLLFLAPGIGVALERFVFRPLAVLGGDPAQTLVASIGVFVLLVGGAALVWGQGARDDAPELVPADPWGQLAVVLVLAAGVGAVIRWTRFGRELRAVVDDRQLAVLGGVDADRVAAAGWAFGSFTAGLTGVLLAPSVRLDPYGLPLLVMEVMAVAVAARMRSLPVAVVVAPAVGVGQSQLTRLHLPGWEGQLTQAVGANLFVVALLVAALVLPGVGTKDALPRTATARVATPPGAWIVAGVLFLLPWVSRVRTCTPRSKSRRWAWCCCRWWWSPGAADSSRWGKRRTRAWVPCSPRSWLRVASRGSPRPGTGRARARRPPGRAPGPADRLARDQPPRPGPRPRDLRGRRRGQPLRLRPAVRHFGPVAGPPVRLRRRPRLLRPRTRPPGRRVAGGPRPAPGPYGPRPRRPARPRTGRVGGGRPGPVPETPRLRRGRGPGRPGRRHAGHGPTRLRPRAYDPVRGLLWFAAVVVLGADSALGALAAAALLVGLDAGARGGVAAALVGVSAVCVGRFPGGPYEAVRAAAERLRPQRTARLTELGTGVRRRLRAVEAHAGSTAEAGAPVVHRPANAPHPRPRASRPLTPTPPSSPPTRCTPVTAASPRSTGSISSCGPGRSPPSSVPTGRERAPCSTVWPGPCGPRGGRSGSVDGTSRG